jgi:hypothetical protein
MRLAPLEHKSILLIRGQLVPAFPMRIHPSARISIHCMHERRIKLATHNSQLKQLPHRSSDKNLARAAFALVFFIAIGRNQHPMLLWHVQLLPPYHLRKNKEVRLMIMLEVSESVLTEFERCFGEQHSKWF